MMLSNEAKQLKAQYTREWRAKNPDRVKAHNNSYWERKAQKLAAGVTDSIVTDKSNVTDISVTENLNVTELQPSVTSLERECSDARCVNCGEIFEPKRTDAKFCSTRCRVQYNRIIKGS